MTILEQDILALKRCCKGNEEAINWLVRWRAYVHAIDDIIDGDDTRPETILKTFASAVDLYSHPFFLKNVAALRQLVLNITNNYADSVAWEKSKTDWQRQWADIQRHAGAEMVLAVASICGGYEHMRGVSLELRTVCHLEHHTADGKPC